MPDDWHTPGPSQQLLAGTTAHVGHICVVCRKAEDPVHPGQVAPEVPGPVSGRNLDGIDHHWVTLEIRRQTVPIQRLAGDSNTRRWVKS